MKIVGYTIVHYGADYIGYAVRSVLPLLDKHNIFYTPHPSHGTQANIAPVESQSQIMAAVPADPKIQWYHMSGVYQEGLQRDSAVAKCKEDGADLILVVDCDEVWDQEVLAAALEQAAGSGKRDNLINFTHLWRSFHWACHDQGWPVRVINPHLPQSATPHYLSDIGQIFHFGYAVRDKIMRYKWQIHGHKAELRAGWLDNIWGKWPPPDDCHPTNDKGFWNPMGFNKSQLPALMRSHPFWDLEIIE